jgi:hypothetical protein
MLAHSLTSTEQSVPLKPGGQLQRNPLITSTHVPNPHGWLAHSSMSERQRVPL